MNRVLITLIAGAFAVSLGACNKAEDPAEVQADVAEAQADATEEVAEAQADTNQSVMEGQEETVAREGRRPAQDRHRTLRGTCRRTNRRPARMRPMQRTKLPRRRLTYPVRPEGD